MARIALIAAAIAYALAIGFLLPRSGPLATSYARASELLAALGLVAGVSLLAAGVVAVWERRPAGPVAIAAGIVWFAPEWVGWEDGPPLVRSLGMVLAPLLGVLLLHLTLVASGGRARAAAPAYAVVGVLSVGLALVRDPFADEHCWSNCSENVFLVVGDEALAQWLGTLLLVIALALGLLVAGVAARRRRPWPVLVPAALAGVVGATYALTLWLVPDEDPARAAFALLFAVRALTFAALGAGLAWVATRERRARAAVARIVAARSIGLRDVLARALGDPGLQVAYPLPGSERTVDARGAPLAPPAGRALTRIEREGQPVAIVAHDGALDGQALAREIGAAARLAVDNERLQAVVLAQLEDLRASLARIVETGDAARRRLERDLHDGAQQRLLALSLELRIARAGATGEPADTLAEAGAEAQAALDELRDLAHGIHPAILTEAGLGPALTALAETAPVPVELGALPAERLPSSVETAAYLFAAAAVEDASATHVAIDVERADGRLHVRIDGHEGWVPPQRLVDRVGALGGRIAASEVELPCA